MRTIMSLLRIHGFITIAALAALTSAGCGSPVETDQFQAASDKLRAIGIASYSVTRDPADATRLHALFKNADRKLVGELDQEADHSFRFSLDGVQLGLVEDGNQATLTLGQRAANLTLGDSGFTGDAQAMALLQEAKPRLDEVELIVEELTPAATVREESAQASCAGKRLVVWDEFRLCNALGDFEGACRQDARSHCPGGRVCEAHFQACFGIFRIQCWAHCN